MTISLSIFRLALILAVAGTASGALAASNNGYDKTPGGMPGAAPLPHGDKDPIRPEIAKPLQAKANAAAAADRKKLDRDEKEAAALKDGNLLVSVGYTYVGFADYQKGISALEQGIAKGGLKHADEAKLMLGIAYFQAGQMPKAIETFESVTGGAGASDVAHLWTIRAKQGA